MRTPAGTPHRLARRAPLVALLCAALVAASAGAWAGVSYDVSAGLPVGDDAQLFLHVTNEYYAPPPEMASVIVHRCPRPVDDYPAVMLLAHASGRPPAEILELRMAGQPWGDIMFRLHVRPEVLFVGIDHDPGPPYGKPWKSWKKHGRKKFAISDDEFVELAKLRVVAGYHRVSPYVVIQERTRGVSYERYVAEKHGKKDHGDAKGKQGGRWDDNEQASKHKSKNHKN